MRLVKLMTLLLALLAVVPAPTRAADCSEGPGDADFDGVCDALDPCEDGGWNQGLREATITLRKLGARPNDDTLRFRAIVLFFGAEAVIDPVATGLRLTVLDWAGTSDDLMLDVAAPGGADWVVNDAGRSWSYRASDVGTSAIKRATVKEIEANPLYAYPHAPRALLVTIDARRGTYDTTSDLELHYFTVAFAGSGTAEVCATMYFWPGIFTYPGLEPWPAEPWEQSCKFRSNGRTLECATGPRVGPCRVSQPRDMMACDALNAAAAQDGYRDTNGTYYTGPCEGLPGFTPSPDVTCTTRGSATRFDVELLHPSSWCDLIGPGTSYFRCQ